MKAPNFTLFDQFSNKHSLADYSGKWLVVYFYPKDDTPGCTTEACSFRDEYDYLEEKGLSILGISKDSVTSHLKFANKYHLNFPLLSDETAATIKAYGAWGTKKMMGREYDGIIRKTFLINPDGEIVKEYPKVTPKDHALEILKDYEALLA
ncbi:MAG: thioredoxin-dependent thiol peroxidase [Candidatus Saccharimonadia bacterium]